MSESQKEDENEIDPDLIETISTTPKDSEMDRTIGPYRLLQKIGEGGMGTVFVAEQTDPVRRKVALKIIKADVGGKSMLARFESERQALALMNHPNIARIFDAGTTEDGEPFFVMEFVNGVPIIDYCRESGLEFRDRIKLFKCVCDAIHHAHQKGIMHRDIKSSNVLVEVVDDEPAVKVIDFGLAKAVGHQLTEKTLFTQFGQVVGTLEYMSPEQANLNTQDVDTRTDVYSLGVLLYELLTGTTPLEKGRIRQAALDQILRLIREEEPELPSARLSKISSVVHDRDEQTTDTEKSHLPLTHSNLLSQKDSKSLKGELDWIVMKSLEKDRSRRYDSVSALASDLQNFLTGDPVQARPYSFSYRFRKSIAKHRNLYVAGSLIFIALLFGVIGTSIGMYRAIKAEGVTRRQYTKIREANERANRHVVEIREILEQFGDSVGTEQISQNSKLNSFREKTFLAVMNHFKQLSHEYPTNNELKFELGKAYYGLGYFYRSIHLPKKSLENYSTAIEILEQLLATDYEHELVATQLGMAHQNTSNVKLWRGLDGFDHLAKAQDIWTELAVTNPNETRFRRNKLMVRSQIASRKYQEGSIDKAIEIEEQNAEELESLVDLQPVNPDYEFLLTSIYSRLANMEIDRKGFKRAQEHAAKSMEFARRYSTRKNDLDSEMDQVNLLNTWSIAIKGSGDPDAALAKRKEALALARKFHKENPDSMTASHSLALVLNNITYDYGFLEQHEAARESINESVKLREQLSKEYPANASYYAEYAKSLSLSALLEHDFGDRDLATEQIKKSVQMLEKVTSRLKQVKKFAKWLEEAKKIQSQMKMAE